MEVPFLEREEIRKAARHLREEAFGGRAPVPVDLEALVFEYLYDEHGVAFLNDRPLGESEREDVLGVTYPFKNEIHVDARLAESGHTGRYRFTVAHEIGHWMLHRPLLINAGEQTDEARFVTLERDVVGSGRGYRPEEWQANCFAIWLLLPDAALGEEFVRRFGDPPFGSPAVARDPEAESPVRPVSRALAATPKDGRVPLHEAFLLSVEATAIALEERDYLVTPNH